MTLRDDASSIYKSCIKNLNPSSRVYNYLKDNNFFEKETLILVNEINKLINSGPNNQGNGKLINIAIIPPRVPSMRAT